MLLLGDGEGRFSESPFARVRPQTSYVHREEGVNVTNCLHRDTVKLTCTLKACVDDILFSRWMVGDHKKKEERRAESGDRSMNLKMMTNGIYRAEENDEGGEG